MLSGISARQVIISQEYNHPSSAQGNIRGHCENFVTDCCDRLKNRLDAALTVLVLSFSTYFFWHYSRISIKLNAYAYISNLRTVFVAYTFHSLFITSCSTFRLIKAFIKKVFF